MIHRLQTVMTFALAAAFVALTVKLLSGAHTTPPPPRTAPTGPGPSS